MRRCPQQVERALLERGLRAATEALKTLQAKADGSAQAEIFRAHQELLEDPTLLEQAHDLLATGKSAAFAWNSAALCFSQIPVMFRFIP